MEYLTIIAFGYLLNFASLSVFVIMTILLTLMPFVTRNTLAIVYIQSRTEKLIRLTEDAKLLRSNLPRGKRWSGDDMAILFPFMMVFTHLKIGYYTVRYGFFDGLIILMEQKIEVLEERYLELNPPKDD